ncbi:MAG TPA: hypothetical protein VM575_01255 [Nocardioides sp.]|nr:hypothetical protein [Nocardioides sp.]
MKTTGTFQGLAALGWLGIAGLQHVYLGKPVKGLVWFFTFGLFFIGTIYDHATAAAQVVQANPQRMPATPTWTGPQVPPTHPNASPHLRVPPPPPTREVVVNVVNDHGAVTAEQIKAIAGGSLAASLRELDKLRYDRLIDDAEFATLKSKLLRDYS